MSSSSVSSRESAAHDIREKQADSTCDYKKYFRITCYALSIISLIVGILVLAKVGTLSNVPRIVGGILVAVAPLFALLPYLTSLQFPCSFSKANSQKTKATEKSSSDPDAPVQIPIPTYDELVANNPILATFEYTKTHLTSHFSSLRSSLLGVSRQERACDSLKDRQMMMKQLREAYTKHEHEYGFEFYVQVIFENFQNANESCVFTWGQRPANL